VTLIDHNPYHTFLPLLYQVATNQLDPSHVGFPAEDLLRGKPDRRFVQATVTGIDLDNRRVALAGMEPQSYDYLVIALGAVANFFGTEGAGENAFPLYTMDDALRLRTHIASRIKAASADPALVDDGALRFVVVGGGATGVEISGAIAELLAAGVPARHRDLVTNSAEVHLYELASQLLTPFKSKLQLYAKQALEERNVVVHLGDSVTAVKPTRVHLKSGATINSHTLVWAAGIAANSLVQELGKRLVQTRVFTEPDLSLGGHPEVFAVGDIALNTDDKTKQQLPQLGSVALQAGACAGENIARHMAGKSTKPFEYKDKGTMATIGRGAAIAEFKSGRTMTGSAAWVAWLGVHLALLSGGEQKANTLVSWSRDALSQVNHRDLFDDDLAA